MTTTSVPTHDPGCQSHLVVISGPSGVGKSTVVRQLIETCPFPLHLSVSATTRAPRTGERNGVHYYFLSPDEFQRRRENDEFIECCEVFGRNFWYGTLRSEIASGLSAGKWVILEIDVQGAMRVLEQHPDALTIFIRPESLAELERRLRGRGTETEERIQKRLSTARHELELAPRYRYQVINDTVPQTVQEICEILSKTENAQHA